MSEDLVYRLRKRAEIRRQISTRKSVQKGARDLISDLLEEAADTIEKLRGSSDKPLTGVDWVGHCASDSLELAPAGPPVVPGCTCPYVLSDGFHYEQCALADTKRQTPAATTDIPEQPPAPKLVLSKTVLKTLALQGQPAPKCQTCGGKGEIPNRDWGVMQPCPTCSKPEGEVK